MIDVNAHILLIYTGGTIGMVENPETGSLEPFDFSHLNSHLPELQRFRFHVDHIVFNPVIDSSDITPEHWKKMVHTIESNYNKYDGFVILHGTDTMSFTASALSFMIENLHKPIVLTGSQLPIGKLRTDAKENLITALEIAADKDELGNPIVPEVCIFFQNDLLRGNRTTKVNAENFNAFKSYNYPNLGKSGIQIRYDRKIIHQPDFDKKTAFHYRLDTRIATLKLFPGIERQTVETILALKNIKAIILETYGSGNAPLSPWFVEAIRETVKRGVIVLNITQCNIGMVDMQRYETGRELLKAGVISGFDATFETAITKLMFLIGHKYEKEDIKIRMRVPMVGEITRLEDRTNERL
ncbi:asparaginase [Dysgonomonas sp. BGC7]|uniref:asparaginase n=1 Tax=Dysgonomonas sp. BGC7 TaxID=1658008 RepID=UPI00068202A6|nr:asparaginase [Dysgonomonas sp. BGC7]MBD8387041.1 asparaginase [Dysgonomonas sp. BGC7]